MENEKIADKHFPHLNVSAPPAAPPLTIDQLNDDCLECIFLRVPELQAQLQISRVCRRFRDIYKHRIWRRDPAYHTLSLEAWREWLPQYEELTDFLGMVRDFITAVDIIDDCLNVFLRECEDLGLTQLKHVTRCELSAFGDCYPSDVDMATLGHLLPNLRWFRCTAPITGRHIATVWPQLEELYLYEDRDKDFEIRSEFLQQLCVELRQLRVLDIRAYEFSQLNLTRSALKHCTALRELRLNLNTLKPVLREVLALPQLARLVVLLDNVIDVARIVNVDTHDYKIYETVEFFEILSLCAGRISGLAVDNYYMPLRSSWDADAGFLDCPKGGGLRSFAFCNCEFEPYVLKKYVRGAPQLQLLCLRNWPLLTNDAVLQFVEHCPQLLHLDVSYCKQLDKRLLDGILKLRQQQQLLSGVGQQRVRIPLLNIYYLRSGLEKEVDDVNPKFWQAQQQFIKLSVDFPPNSEQGLSYVDRGFAFEFE